MNHFWTFQKILVGLLTFLAIIFLGVMLSDGECVLHLLGFGEKDECLTFKKCIAKLLGVSDREKNSTLTFLGIGMGGVLLALQALIANRRAKAMEDTAKAQVEANRKTEQGQRQERLKNAIEHLGHSSESVRIAGTYELQQLARDIEEPQFRRTVREILSAHIRRTTGEEG